MIVDAKSDLLAELIHRRAEHNPIATYWLPALRDSGVQLQVVSFFCVELELLPELALRRGMENVLAFMRAAQLNPDTVLPVRTRGDLEAVLGGERLGLLLAMEGAEALGYDVELIDVFWDLGLRLLSPSWNRRNPFADGAAEEHDGGLSNLGVQLVTRMNELGMLIDLAHASDRTLRQSIELASPGNVLVSHAACRGVFDTPRNLDDDQMRLVEGKEGVICLHPIAAAIDPADPSIDRFVDHVVHAASVVGIDHVGLGGNFRERINRIIPTGRMPEMALVLPDQPETGVMVQGMTGPEGYRQLIEQMLIRGFKDDDVERIMSGNLVRLLRNSLPA